MAENEHGIRFDEEAKTKSYAVKFGTKNVIKRLPDSEEELHLKDVFLGFEREDNLKEPLKGFSDSDTEEMFPIIEECSKTLFEIVEEMESELASANISLLLSHDKTIPIPKTKYSLPGGGDIHLQILNSEMTQQVKMNYDFKGETFLKEKLVPFLQPFQKGWKREIVMRSELLAKQNDCDIVYHTPDNVKLRSSNQIAQYLEKNSFTGLTMENFWFGKGRIDPCSIKNESIRTACDWNPQIVEKRKKKTERDMDMGMLPPKYRTRDLNSSKVLSLSCYEKFRRRDEDLAGASNGIFKEYNDPYMFQISAIGQSNLTDAETEQLHTMQIEVNLDPELFDYQKIDEVEEHSKFAEFNQSSEQLLPCSLYCFGMEGIKVPSLQCKRCLCMYHPDCLNIPPNLNCNGDILCNTCQKGSSEERMSNDIVSQAQKSTNIPDMKTKIGHKLPPLVPKPYFTAIPHPPSDMATCLPRLTLPTLIPKP